MTALQRFMRLMLPYRRWLIAAAGLALLSALSAVTLLALSGWFISAAAIAGLSADGVAVVFNYLQPAAQIRALAIARTLTRYGERLLSHEATFRGLTAIRCWLFAQLIKQPPGRVALRHSGDLLSCLTQDIETLEAFYLRLLQPLTVALIGSLLVTVFIAQFSPALALALFVCFWFNAAALPLCFQVFARNTAAREQQEQAQFKAYQLDVLQGFAELTVFQAYRRLSGRCTEQAERLLQTQLQHERWLAGLSAVTQLVSLLAMLLTLIGAAGLLQDERIDAAQLAMLVFLVWATFEWSHPVAESLLMSGQSRRAAQRVQELALPPESPVKAASATGLRTCHNVLVLENVHYRYPGQQEWVLQKTGLTLRAGEKLVLTGPSGAGKTTLLQLVLGFIEPQLGRILLDGSDLTCFRHEQIFRRVGWLSQHSCILSGTVRENLSIGRAGATTAELTEACERAGMAPLLARLPHGLDTLVGEHGALLSGGEARRLALARLYLKNAPLWLLDEPTEGLDETTETDVLTVLSDFCRDKSVLIVSHRPAALTIADTCKELSGGLLRDC